MIIRESFRLSKNNIVDVAGNPVDSLKDSNGVDLKIDPKNAPDRILVKVPATHGGFVNHNGFFYKPDGMNLGYLSWTQPFHKPVLINHNEDGSPIGRVVDSHFVVDDPALYRSLYGKTENIPTAHIDLVLDINDKDAIANILNGKYLTVSQSAICYDVRCSECDADMRSPDRCEHQRNSIIDGKRVHWKFGAMTYKEVSFVNVPSDEFAKIESIEAHDTEGVLKDSHIEDEEIAINRCMITVLDRVVSGKQEERIVAEKPITETPEAQDEAMFTTLDEQLTLVIETLGDLLPKEITDAVLSAEKRKDLPDSAFCGPNRSFPVPDCSHVRAARSLIGRYKGPGDKSKITAGVNSKAEELNCPGGKDSNEPLSLSDFLTVFGLASHLVTVSDHNQKLQELQDQITALTAERDAAKTEVENKDKIFKDQLAHTIVDIRLALGKLSKEKVEPSLKDLSERNTDSLLDTINDLRDEIDSPTLKPVADPGGVTTKDQVPSKTDKKQPKFESRKEAVKFLLTPSKEDES